MISGRSTEPDESRADEDPDADPQMLQAERSRPQPDLAEGTDDPSETRTT
jgi:hypothetical protein